MTTHSVLEKFSTVRMIDVRTPANAGRALALARRTRPGSDLKLLIERLKQTAPAQPSPKFTAAPAATVTPE